MPKPVAPPVAEPAEETVASTVTIVLDDSNRELLEDCEAGSQKWVLLQIDTHDDATITATPLEVEYEEEVEEVAEPAGVPKAIGKISKGGY